MTVPGTRPLVRTYQERPRAYKGGERGGILDARVVDPVPERAAEREADGSHEVPEADMPSQGPHIRQVPPFLHLEHNEGAGDYEAAASYDLCGSLAQRPVAWIERRLKTHLRRPVDPIERLAVEPLVGGRQGRYAGDPEDGGPQELREAGEEADLPEVVSPQLRPGRAPTP